MLVCFLQESTSHKFYLTFRYFRWKSHITLCRIKIKEVKIISHCAKWWWSTILPITKNPAHDSAHTQYYIPKATIESVQTLNFNLGIQTNSPLWPLIKKGSELFSLCRNNFRTETGFVLITQQNLRKFEFLQVHSRKIQIFANFAGW